MQDFDPRALEAVGPPLQGPNGALQRLRGPAGTYLRWTFPADLAEEALAQLGDGPHFVDRAAGSVYYDLGDAQLVAEIVGRAGDVDAAQALIGGVAAALAHAGPHQNLSPWRIAVRADGTVIVFGQGLRPLDVERWGLAVNAGAGAPTTPFASLRYVAPEQVGLASSADPQAADVFSLAIVAAEIALGQPLLRGADGRALLDALPTIGEAPELRRLPPGLGDRLRSMLARRPEDRPPLDTLAGAAPDRLAAWSRAPAAATPPSAEGPLQSGRVLGGRFELHGVIGRGGTAVVWLATDRLRRERVALKVLHPHLVADPGARRRLEREVNAAAVLRSDAALTPFDVHEIDGHLALSLPFHAGQTLTERVATRGALSAEDARQLGVRVATALADAHRVGVLHRDVTANNVLVGDDVTRSVLTDFGLARLQGASRSTALLGTAGFAAPEVYAGERADPRSDLYGLGCVLYLAITGKPAFDARDPMGALRRQLDESYPAIERLAPRCPPDLARLVASMLRADPSGRPQGAREVLDRLERRAPVEPTPPPPARAGLVRPLPTGAFTVELRERDEQRGRRDHARRRARRVSPTLEDGLRQVVEGALVGAQKLLGVDLPAGQRSAEQALHAAIAELAGAREEQLVFSPVLYERRFRLIDATDAVTADRLANLARTLGFRARVYEIAPAAASHRNAWPWMWYVFAQVVGWSYLGQVPAFLAPVAFAAMLAFTIAFPIFVGGRQDRPRIADRSLLERVPVAYPAALAGVVVGASVASSATANVTSRAGVLEERARAAISGLLADVEASTTLPELAKMDLRSTAREMERQTTELAADIARVERVLADAGDDGEIEVLHARAERLAALERAGERVDARERDQLQRTIDQHRAARDAADRLESELASGTARLVELASAAAQARRELARQPVAHAADEVVAKLARESRAMMEARREMARARAME